MGQLVEIRFRLSLSAEAYLRYYRGQARDIVTRSLDGRTVRFAARHLQRFVSHDGVHGTFVLRYQPGGRFHSIERIGQ